MLDPQHWVMRRSGGRGSNSAAAVLDNWNSRALRVRRRRQRNVTAVPSGNTTDSIRDLFSAASRPFKLNPFRLNPLRLSSFKLSPFKAMPLRLSPLSERPFSARKKAQRMMQIKAQRKF